MITAIVIPQDSEFPLREEPIVTLADYQRIVRGYVELVHADGERLTIVVNEDGKVLGMPINRRATCMWWLLNPASRGADVLVGDAVIVGAKNGHRTLTNVPDGFRTLLLETTTYAVETRMGDRRGTWRRIEAEFTNYFESAIYALNLAERTPGIHEARVVAA